MTDDATLVERAAGGDEAAFGVLVRRHTPRMYRVALRITGSAAEAEDVVQEAWLAAWRSLGGFRHESAVSTWLYRVVTNGALAMLRRRKPTISLDSPEPAGKSTVDSALLAAAEPGPEGASCAPRRSTPCCARSAGSSCPSGCRWCCANWKG